MSRQEDRAKINSALSNVFDAFERAKFNHGDVAEGVATYLARYVSRHRGPNVSFQCMECGKNFVEVNACEHYKEKGPYPPTQPN